VRKQSLGHDFRKNFLAIFPKILKYAKAREFMDLTQENMTITHNAGRLTKLARFAPYMVADEENLVRKFEQGLNPRIHDRVVCFEIQPTQAKVYALTLGKVETEKEVVTGTLPLFIDKAVIIFNSGATHSFISAKYARRFHINLELMEVGVVVSTPVGKSVM
jgi:hypothetical protein